VFFPVPPQATTETLRLGADDFWVCLGQLFSPDISKKLLWMGILSLPLLGNVSPLTPLSIVVANVGTMVR